MDKKMIARLEGIVVHHDDASMIINVQGVGYDVHVSKQTLFSSIVGNPIVLWVETLFRQDGFQLLGFSTLEDKKCFQLVTSVQGVGPKSALSLLGSLTSHEIYGAIINEDKSLLSKADGIGPKAAVRLITELKEKIIKLNLGIVDHTGGNESSMVLTEAVSALGYLGYKNFEIIPVVRSTLKSNPKASLEDVIRVSLSQLVKVS
jgi:Holliday junction DNA helicase RuvA